MPVRTTFRRWSVGVFAGFALASAPGCRRQPTYHQDVAPILAASCVGCHRDNGVAATPRLETYAEAAAVAAKIALAVRTRDMPPWGADNSGQCRTWHGASWLPDADVRTLVGWAEGSRTEGDAAQARTTPPPPPSFGPVGAVAGMKGDYTPGLGPMAYRCFIVDPDLDADRMIAAFRVVSSEPRSVEQITLYALDSLESELAAEKLDDADLGLGYACYGSARVAEPRLVMSWTWDSPVLRMPTGLAVRMQKRRKAILQIHYNVIATGLGVPTRTRVELEFAGSAKEAHYLLLSPEHLSLAAGQARVEARSDVAISQSMDVLGVAPRMHTLGKTMQLDLVRGARRECVASFDHWSFYRQRLFEYASPLHIDAGDTLQIACIYNTQSRTGATAMGETIDDEECLAWLLVTP